jgi:uncharacterized protein YdeI (YjbR/CyaY-like superfamily)
LRYRSIGEIDRRLIEAYVRESIALVRQGVEIRPARNQPLTVPSELRAAFRKFEEARRSFSKLTPGKRREYAEYIASAKRGETKQRRIDKILPMIASGVGLNDEYRGC